MTGIGQNPSLGDAASHYLAGLPAAESGASQQEIYKFIRWFGRGRSFTGLMPAEVDNYAEHLSLSDTEYLKKLELVRKFLVYAKKKGWSKTNLATHLKARKGKNRKLDSSRQVSHQVVSLTREGYAELEAELAGLKSQRLVAIDEIRRAAADKDFRENAPLEAARERRGQLEGRIQELEEIMKLAVVIDEKQKATPTINVGNSVVLCNLESGEEVCYTLVSSREADPLRGKISSASPIGRAVIGQEEGEIVEIDAPAGRLRYQIKEIKH